MASFVTGAFSRRKMMNDKIDIKKLLGKYLKGDCSRDELDTALGLLGDFSRRGELRQALSEFWDEEPVKIPGQDSEEDFEAILNQLHHRIRLQKESKVSIGIRKKVLAFSKIAAVLLLGLFLGIVIQRLKPVEEVYYTSIAPKGSISQLVLPDSTMVYLNAGSEIRYSAEVRNRKREVFLQGEAWFEVVKNDKKPFVVHTPWYQVQVTGTKFNVKAYPGDETIATTLEEGSVQVLFAGSRLLRENKQLQPGEQLVYRPQNRTLTVEKVNTHFYTSWKDNKLIFINMNLKDLILLLERKYGVDIEVTDNVVLDYHYDGTIKNESILEVLDLLRETLPVKYKIEGQTIYITKK